uniref:Uncharacterized protein n=1 Tax=Lotus japonicus TaxID=34305 RepID=I3SNY3_LOTJA|nr:unknown [Lotus japonicus]
MLQRENLSFKSWSGCSNMKQKLTPKFEKLPQKDVPQNAAARSPNGAKRHFLLSKLFSQ